MKKLFICFALAGMTASAAFAQGDCMAFFPNVQGATLVNKTYDAQDNLLNTTVYRVNNAYDYVNGSTVEIGVTIANDQDVVIDRGSMDARCTDGNFYLRMGNMSLSPETMQALGNNTGLVGNFLDYPNTFDSTYPFAGTLQTTEGEYTIKSKNDEVDDVRVRIYNRQHDGSDIIVTPAGNFNASKVTFMFDCTKGGVTKTHRAVEWYAPGAGIVRSETYDNDGNLENYTVLTTLQDA